MNGKPYIASEDSALLRSALRGRSGSMCLEMGAGNGGNMVELSGSFDLVVGTDIVSPGMSDWSRAGADYVLADRARCLRDGTFDLVVFNPPYLQSDGVSDVAVDGGREGEVPLGFLREALRVVKDSGKVLLLLSDEVSLGAFEEECRRRGFIMAKVASRRLFFEGLSVYEAEGGRRSQR